MKKYTIRIHQPCTEDWNQMKLTPGGKHCASCNHVVVDFSKLTDTEVMRLLQAQEGKKICGNFMHSQVNRPLSQPTYKQKKHWPATAAMLLAGLFQVLPQNGYTQRENFMQKQPRSILFAKGGQGANHVATEPAKDSLITFTIQLKLKDSNQPIPGVEVNIEQIGVYTSNLNGQISFSVAEEKIPKEINLTLWADGYRYEHIYIKKARVMHTRNVVLFMIKQEELMLRGDVSIEEIR
jgi:hypothetical protein